MTVAIVQTMPWSSPDDKQRTADSKSLSSCPVPLLRVVCWPVLTANQPSETRWLDPAWPCPRGLAYRKRAKRLPRMARLPKSEQGHAQGISRVFRLASTGTLELGQVVSQRGPVSIARQGNNSAPCRPRPLVRSSVVRSVHASLQRLRVGPVLSQN